MMKTRITRAPRERPLSRLPPGRSGADARTRAHPPTHPYVASVAFAAKVARLRHGRQVLYCAYEPVRPSASGSLGVGHDTRGYDFCIPPPRGPLEVKVNKWSPMLRRRMDLGAFAARSPPERHRDPKGPARPLDEERLESLALRELVHPIVARALTGDLLGSRQDERQEGDVTDGVEEHVVAAEHSTPLRG